MLETTASAGKLESWKLEAGKQKRQTRPARRPGRPSRQAAGNRSGDCSTVTAGPAVAARARAGRDGRAVRPPAAPPRSDTAGRPGRRESSASATVPPGTRPGSIAQSARRVSSEAPQTAQARLPGERVAAEASIVAHDADLLLDAPCQGGGQFVCSIVSISVWTISRSVIGPAPRCSLRRVGVHTREHRNQELRIRVGARGDSAAGDLGVVAG